MILYKSPPLVEFIRSSRSGDSLKLRRNMIYYIARKVITIPKGFCCDGMSVPRLLWSIVSPTIHPETIAGALLHDFLYRTHSYGWTRKQADVLFYVLMRSDGFPRWRATLAYIGVRLFGDKAWNDGGKNK